ncbi:P-loop NTPase fold protein [Spiroplasma phoeniceum]|uniref:KAP NTPase domain-containing protein n=1 Tax=Spiroplasma phoeniceum P40 TaxID=1276259 RepID=A0A345DP57_9MOLU|nr:P-loop NTPase fold protein [Spiroplasma phoeniceum]AXF95995.1 hypothetical protein SDAV_001015 [Spiroplasma phoeniceum P40]
MTYNTEIIINSINAFFAKTETKQLNNTNNDNNNLNIKGQWGSGKTTYIKKLKEKIKEIKNEDNKNKYQVKIFNVWEYEISDNIFVSILCDILRFFNYQPKNKFDLGKFVKSFITVSGEYAINFLSHYFKIESPLKYIKKIIQKSKDKEDNLLQFDNYNEAINEIIRQINLYTQYSKNIFIFDELDRCTTPKMIEFLSIIKNILFRLNNCFFIVSCDSDRINRTITQNENNGINENENENYTDKIFYVNIKITILSKLDEKIINNDSELIKNYISNFENKTENNYRQLNKAIERKNKVIKIIENNFNINENKKLFEFVTFWIYYKEIDLEKCIKNISDKNLEIIVKNYFMKNQSYDIKSDYFYNEKISMQQKDNIKNEILNINFNGYFLFVYDDRNQSFPFSFLIPFIDIKNFDFKCIENINNFSGSKYMQLKNGVYYVSYRNIVNYISNNFKDLIDILFEFFDKNKKDNFNTNINIKEYFEYMQNII